MPVPAALVAICLLLAPGEGLAPGLRDPDRHPEARVRLTGARAALVFAYGMRRSETLRRLVDRIEASNVMVYVEMRPGMHANQAGGVTFVSSAGPFRYLRIRLNPVQTTLELAMTLAHELQHVVEIVDHPEVRDEATLIALYRRIGAPSRILRGFGWETIEAQSVGDLVRRELADHVVAADGQEPT
jgi:hypothetical protein